MKSKFNTNIIWGSVYQLGIVLLIFWLSRFVFFIHNASVLKITFAETVSIALNGIIFDLCILTYATLPFIILRFLPFQFLSSRGWIKVTNLYLIIIGAILLTLNFIDTPYYLFRGRRMSWTAFTMHITDSGTPKLLYHYAFSFWKILLGWLFFIIVMVWLILRVNITRLIIKRSTHILSSIAITLITILCIRGFRINDRPLNISMCNQYVAKNSHIPFLINTPFAMAFQLKDISNATLIYFNEDELLSLRNSLVVPPDTLQPNHKNIMMIIIESGGSIHSNVFSPVGPTPYSSSMSFIDSLAMQSLINVHFYASGVNSPQGITQLLASVPFFDAGSSYYVNSKQSDIKKDYPASLLKTIGYENKFYYGCSEGNFHIDETAKITGFHNFTNQESYNDDSQSDGVWGIYDKPMAEYIAKDLCNLQQPFFATWFTITAHSPHILPDTEISDDYTYKESGPEQTMEYTDKAIRTFFNLAQSQSWYQNTIFIITSDHGQRDYIGSTYSDDPYVSMHLPFIIFTPDHSIPHQIVTDAPMGQIDVAPTILHLIGYNKPHISIGCNLLDNTKEHYALASKFNTYYVYGTKYMVAYETPDKPFAVYNINEKPYPHTELSEYDITEVDRMTNWFKALIQDYTTRIKNNDMTYRQQHS